MLTVTPTRPRESLEEMRFLIDGSREASSDPTRRCISRNRLLTVLRSTETEKSSPATIALPYPVIDFIVFYPQITGLNLGHLRNLWILFLIRELQFVKLSILSALGKQFCVCSDLDDPSRFHHDDHIRTPHSRQPMCDHDRGAISDQVAECTLDQSLRFSI